MSRPRCRFCLRTVHRPEFARDYTADVACQGCAPGLSRYGWWACKICCEIHETEDATVAETLSDFQQRYGQDIEEVPEEKLVIVCNGKPCGDWALEHHIVKAG